MDHNTLPSPQFEMPAPQAKPGEVPRTQEADQETQQATEKRNMETPTQAPVSPAQASQSVADATAHYTPPPLAPAAALPDSSVVAGTMSADDGDLIEKAWVDKAKEIVSQTKNDPHRQNTEINKVKKEYILKRYHKDVKLNDE